LSEVTKIGLANMATTCGSGARVSSCGTSERRNSAGERLMWGQQRSMVWEGPGRHPPFARRPANGTFVQTPAALATGQPVQWQVDPSAHATRMRIYLPTTFSSRRTPG
jgi:hypothetical protein